MTTRLEITCHDERTARRFRAMVAYYGFKSAESCLKFLLAFAEEHLAEFKRFVESAEAPY